jgi:hypothetical protein
LTTSNSWIHFCEVHSTRLRRAFGSDGCKRSTLGNENPSILHDFAIMEEREYGLMNMQNHASSLLMNEKLVIQKRIEN